MKRFYSLILLFAIVKVNAQCPVITCPSSATISCSSPTVITATSNYSANITSRWIGPGGIPIASAGTATSVTNLNHKGTYSVEFTDNMSNCVTTETLNVVITNTAVNSDYTLFNLAANNFVQDCPNAVLSFSFVNGQTYPSNGAYIGYTVVPVGTPISSGFLSGVPIFSFNICGDYVFAAIGGASQSSPNGCLSSYTVRVGCSTLTPITLSVSPNSSICIGSGATFIVSGASNYTWSTGALTSSITVIPSSTTIYTVSGDSPASCVDTKTISVSVDSTCAMVWPGDANSDGVVDNTDVFEIGTKFSATGAPRSTTSNAYSAQYATSWSGTVSTGKNKAHADCNGDGTINNGDTLAIYNNYSLTHSFKPSGTSSANSDISIVSDQTFVDAGMWNKVDIILGSTTNQMTGIYGVAFDLDFDQSLIESNSAYILYTPSFLNASNQNVDFRKNVFVNGKIYAATVRTDGAVVNGDGKIGEFWFKVKTGIADNTDLNIGIANAKKTNKTVVNNLTSDATVVKITTNVTGLKEVNILKDQVRLFPNPASNQLTLQSTGSAKIKYSVLDITGREIAKGEFTNSTQIDLSNYASGSYIVHLESGSVSAYKKLVVQK